MTEKLELVERHREEYGLNRCLKLVGVSKSTWHRRMRRREESKREARDRRLKGAVIQIVKEHPAYGYRRILVELLESFGPASITSG